MKTLPKIICSSVIRAANRGDSHGGIYIVDCESGENKKLLDWDKSDIDWDGRGGDRGVRGMSFYKDFLYAAAGDEVFCFDEKMGVVNSWRSPYLKHTHEVCRVGNLLYIIANLFDSILVLDMDKQEWSHAWHFQGEHQNKAVKYDPTVAGGAHPIDKLHLDAVYIENGVLYYCGAHMKDLRALDLETGDCIIYQDGLGHTHNARPYGGGVLFNMAFQHKTCLMDIFKKIRWEGTTPLYKKEDMTYTDLPKEHAQQGYVRGMVVNAPLVVVGNAPATINIFEIGGSSEPIKSIQLSNDIRNSICGIARYEW